MKTNKLFDRYDEAFLDFSDNYETFMQQRRRALLNQIELDAQSSSQRTRLQTVLNDAAKFFDAADRLYRNVAKTYRRRRDERDLCDIEYIQEETSKIGYLVWKLENIFGAEGLNYPKVPTFAVAN